MNKIKFIGNTARNFINDESGATAIEYALLVVIMGVGVVASLLTLVGAIDGSVTYSKDAVEAAG